MSWAVKISLYDALDSAMKFVKGNSIVGFIITVINIVARLITGVMQKGMTAEKALKVYAILTIGVIQLVLS
jgi:type III secretion protein V